jgi:hypothetical protein
VPYIDIADDNDIQLNLVEGYLLKLRYFSDMKSKNHIDFGYLKDKQVIRYYANRGLDLVSNMIKDNIKL